jgi:FtsP/CotA-like multicopper oxidase with cupredoxin domain
MSKDSHDHKEEKVDNFGAWAISRRDLIKVAGVGLTALAGINLRTTPTCTQAFAMSAKEAGAAQGSSVGIAPKPNKPQYVLKIGEQKLNPDLAKPEAAITANGVLPAPEIRVKEGEVLRIQVENRLIKQDTSIHWHGILVPAGMDGVPFISQAPIPPGQIYIYEYPVLQSGTYWYHSHFDLQEQMGLGGPLIIEPKSEPLPYDRDYVIFLSDWLHYDPGQVIPNLRKQAKKETTAMKMPKGPDLADVRYDALLLNGRGNKDPWSGLAKPGERVRLRIINGATSTFFRFLIEGIDLQITHADGLAVRPVVADSLFIGMGETYDAIVSFDASGSHLIRAQGLGQEGKEAIGVLHTPDVKPQTSAAKPFEAGRRPLSYRQLLAPAPTNLPQGPAKEFHLNLTGNMDRYIWSINNQVYPRAEPLLIEPGERVRLSMVNQTAMWHPMHLHGHFFRLQEPGVEAPFAPLKHTVSVGPKQTVKIEFFADNPGKWFFHCHNLYHLEAGMAREFIYKVS